MLAAGGGWRVAYLVLAALASGAWLGTCLCEPHPVPAAAEHGQPTPPSHTGQNAQRKLERPADQQRDRGEQADLRVAQPQVMTNQRERGALDAVN